MIVSELCIYPIKSCQGIKLQTAEVTAKGLRWDREMMIISYKGKFLTQRQFPQLAKVKVELIDKTITLSTEDNSLDAITFEPTLEGEPREVEIWRDNTTAIDQGDRLANWFHQLLKLDEAKKCRLVRQSPQHKREVNRKLAAAVDNSVSFADGYPCLLTTTGSLAELNRRIRDTYQEEAPIIGMDRFRSNIVVTTEAAFPEDTWRTVQIGSVKFGAVKPCSRCIVTTIHQSQGELNKLKEPLRTLGTFRQLGGQGVMFGENMIPYAEGFINVGDRLEVLETR